MTLTRCHDERMNEGLSCSQLLRPQKFRMCILRENMNQTHTKVQNALQVPNQILFLDTRVIWVLSSTKIDTMRTPFPSQTQTSIGNDIHQQCFSSMIKLKTHNRAWWSTLKNCNWKCTTLCSTYEGGECTICTFFLTIKNKASIYGVPASFTSGEMLIDITEMHGVPVHLSQSAVQSYRVALRSRPVHLLSPDLRTWRGERA